jgi:hypothetical protein
MASSAISLSQKAFTAANSCIFIPEFLSFAITEFVRFSDILEFEIPFKIIYCITLSYVFI